MRELQSEESKAVMQSKDLNRIVAHYRNLKKDLCGVLQICRKDFLQKHKGDVDSLINELKIVAWYVMNAHLIASEDMIIRAMDIALDKDSRITGLELEMKFKDFRWEQDLPPLLEMAFHWSGYWGTSYSQPIVSGPVFPRGGEGRRGGPSRLHWMQL